MQLFACGIWNPGFWNPEYSSSFNLIRKTVKPQRYLVTNEFTETAEKKESFVKAPKSENTTRKAFSDMKTFQRYLSSVNKGNVEVLDLPADDVDYLLAKFFFLLSKFSKVKKNFLGQCLTWHKFPPKSPFFSYFSLFLNI